jgi:hypothetical protein
MSCASLAAGRNEQAVVGVGADGVMTPFRPQAGSAKGKTVWREVKVGVLARLGERVTKAGQRVTHLTQRRLVAVLGDIDALSPRLWLEAVRQGVLSSPQVVWLADGGRGFWRLFEERFVTAGLIGTLTGVNAQRQTSGTREAFRICLALADLRSGKLVSTLVSGYHPAGRYSSQFTANGSQQKLAAGIYMLELEACDLRLNRKLIVQ